MRLLLWGSCLVIIVLFTFSSCKQSNSVFNFKLRIQDTSTRKMLFGASDYIAWADVSPMIKAYKNNSKALKIKLSDGSVAVLEGLQLDADHLRAMLVDPSISKVELLFAVNKADLSKPGADQTFTIVTAPVYFDLGMKKYRIKKVRNLAGGKLDPANSELIDFCDPCPRNCPDSTQ